MLAAQLYQIAVVFELLRVAALEAPVDSVDRIGRLVGVMDAFLVAEHFLAGKHEGRALRCEHDGLSQSCGTLTVGLSRAGH